MGTAGFLTSGPFDPIVLPNGGMTKETGGFNLIACLVSLLVTWLLVAGTSKSAKVTSVLVMIKIVALTAFVALAFPVAKEANFHPLLPTGWGTPGVLGAAASIFFAFVGFDAVSTASEETTNPNRNIPIGLIGSLAICTVFYLLVAYTAVGAEGAQPGGPLSQAKDPLAFILRNIGHGQIGDMVGWAAIAALPSVVLMMIFGQTRILFTMARDGLMPKFFAAIHPKYHTPHKVTIVTGVFVSLFAGLFPVGVLADVSNSGTLFAFFAVALGVLILRKTDPTRKRPFKTPMVWIVGPGAMAGSAFLFYSLDAVTLWFFVGWAITGLIVYFGFARRHSAMAPGNAELPGQLEAAPLVHEGPEPGP